MPTLQVINREEDPVAKTIGQAGNDIADTLYKQQSLKLTGQYYKILAKNAQTEQDKFKFDRLAKLNSDILPQIAGTKDPATKQMLIKGVVDSGLYNGDAQTFFHDVADSHETTQDHHDTVRETAGAPDLNSMQADTPYATEGQLRGAQLPNLQAEASLHQANANMLNTVQSRMAALGAGGQGGDNGGGELPPGTTFTGGGLTIPLNQKLTDTEQGSVSGAEKFQPIADNINKLISSGTLNSGRSRTFTQWLADGGQSPTRRLLTQDNTPLEELASNLAELKKYAFTEGGKTLSPTEQKIVNAGLTVTGKGDKQIMHDVKESIRILQSKRALAIGGANAAKFKQGSPGMNSLNTQAGTPKKQYTRTGTDSTTGKRVGMLADGTIEEIQ